MKIGLFYDFDLTLTEEYQQFPIFRFFKEELNKTYGIKNPLDYFKRFANKGDMGVGWMQPFLKDASLNGSKVFYCLTNERMEKEFAPQIKLAAGIPGWFPTINQFCSKLGLQPEHHVISAGITPLIKGTAIFPYLSSLHCGSFFEDENGICQIERSIEPSRKVDFIKKICKGDGRGSTEDISLEEYALNYCNSVVIGDGQSDLNMFRHIKERGGIAIAVFEPGSEEDYNRAKNNLGRAINLIVPRDYSSGSVLEQVVQKALTDFGTNECNMDYDLVNKTLRNQTKNLAVKGLVLEHYRRCDYCQKRNEVKAYFNLEDYLNEK